MDKTQHCKPGLYTLFYENLKDIAKGYGYNLVLHGSLNRDLDLIAIPWQDWCTSKHEVAMIKEFNLYLTGKEGDLNYTLLPGKRHGYTISLNRGNRCGEWVRYEDREWYLDISVIPCWWGEGYIKLKTFSDTSPKFPDDRSTVNQEG